MKKESKQSGVEIIERAFSTSTIHIMNHLLDNFPHTHLSAKKSLFQQVLVNITAHIKYMNISATC